MGRKKWPESIDWESPKYAPWTKTTCGENFKEALECFLRSESQIKGIDCAEQIRSFVDCCRENENACMPGSYPPLSDDD